MTPRTEAGRRLWAWAGNDEPVQPDDWYGAILEIEKQAAALALAGAVERVGRLPHGGGWPTGHPAVTGYEAARAAALAAIRQDSEEPKPGSLRYAAKISAETWEKAGRYLPTVELMGGEEAVLVEDLRAVVDPEREGTR